MVEDSQNKKQHKKIENLSVNVKAISNNFEISISTTVDSDDLAGATDLLVDEISKSKIFSGGTPQTGSDSVSDAPTEKLATRLNVEPKELEKSKLVLFKGDNFQILKGTKLEPSEVGLLILAINEFVYDNNSMTYDDWKKKFDACKLKGKLYPSAIVGNYKKYDRIESEQYDEDKILILTGKAVDDLTKTVTTFLNTNS